MAKGGDTKLVVILLILFVVAFAVIVALCYYRWDDNKKLKVEIDDVKRQIKVEQDRKKEIPKLRQLKSQRVEAINQLTKILPSETESSHQELLRLLSGFAQKSKVLVKQLLPPEEIPEPKMAIIRYKYNILVEGTFPQFVRFLNQIETHTRFLKVDSFEVSNERVGHDYWPSKDGEKKIKLQITTYTYNPVK